MHLSPDEDLALRLRRRSFQLALADLRVQGALIASAPYAVPYLCDCPCCGYPTLHEPAGYDICPICGWEDDGQDDADADDVQGGPNGNYSLTEARRNFIDAHTSYRPSDAAEHGRMHSAAERDRLIEAYDALLPDVHPWEFIAALPRIRALHRALDEREHGEDTVRQWDAQARDEQHRADQVRHAWSTLAQGRHRSAT